ncbi:MAG TPA: hypothetical protein PLW34_08920 [Termitinemataceae bacterium]|nr:hypothetical protein [Termitinemataceae bacterium]HOM23817.1 hypothetical protein [Termitinemataceae bacterium]HPQ00894.1 hypothetical protein [Termitinemataceae bacterium]
MKGNHTDTETTGTTFSWVRAQRISPAFPGWNNPSWESAAVRILFVRLSPLEDLEESNTHLFLFSLMRSVLGEKAYGDFCFFPSYKERQAMEKTGKPWVQGLVSGKGWEAFDYLLCSCSYALELLNLPLMLRKSGIPLRASIRKEEGEPPSSLHQYPLIILGGSNILASQGLIYPDGDSFVDALYFGEAEAYGKEFFSILAEHKGLPKTETLRILEKAIPALWVATPWETEGQKDPVVGVDIPGNREEQSQVVTSGHITDEAEPPHQPIVQAESSPRPVQYARGEVQDSPFLPTAYPLFNHPGADTARLQISWGCPSFCTFCFEGWERKPYREVPLPILIDQARKLATNTGASTVELYSFNFNAHGDLFPLLYELHQVFDRVNMMSQRADILAELPGMLDYELIGEKRSFTLGIEGISQRMRDYYAKGLSEAQIKRLIRELWNRGVREIKLFFILSGHEEEDDFREFQALCEYIRNISEKSQVSENGGRPRVIFSAGFLVRMPWTPLAFDPCTFARDHLEALARRMGTIISAAGFEFRTAMEWDEYVLDQLIVAGNHQVAHFLEEGSRRGLLYDKGIRGSWEDLVQQYLTYRETLEQPGGFEGHIRPFLAPPYGNLQLSVSSEARRRAYEASQRALHRFPAQRAREAPQSLSSFYPFACFRLPGESASCGGCGACHTTEERRFLTEHQFQGSFGEYGNLLEQLIKKKRKSRPRYLMVRLPPSFAGIHREYLSAHLLSAVFQREPGLIGRLFRIEEALWSRGPWEDRLGTLCAGWTVLGAYGISGTTPQGDPWLSDEDLALVQRALAAFLHHPVTLCEAPSPEAWYPERLRINWPASSMEKELQRLRRWLASLKIATTERKGPGGERIFEVAPKDRKKRLLRELRFFFYADTEGPKERPFPSSLYGEEEGPLYGAAPLPFPEKEEENPSCWASIYIEGAQKVSLQGLFTATDYFLPTVEALGKRSDQAG